VAEVITALLPVGLEMNAHWKVSADPSGSREPLPSSAAGRSDRRDHSVRWLIRGSGRDRPHQVRRVERDRSIVLEDEGVLARCRSTACDGTEGQLRFGDDCSRRQTRNASGRPGDGRTWIREYRAVGELGNRAREAAFAD
jgi:hypothetical protein